MATRKKHQLDINLSRIKDEAVRDALDALITQVNTLSQSAVVSSQVKAEKLTLHSGLFSVTSNGMVSCRAINTDQGGPVKMKLFSGSIAANTGVSYSLSENHKIFAVIGWTSVNGGSSGADEAPMDTTSNPTRCYLSDVGTDVNTFRVFNADTDDTNYFRAIIFYTEI